MRKYLLFKKFFMPKATKKTTKQIVDSVGVLENANTVHALAYFPFFIGPIAMFFL